MGTMPGDILDLIDNALEDWSASPDAMRWRPDAPQMTDGSGYTRGGGERPRPSVIPEWAREAADAEQRDGLPSWRPGIDTFPSSGQLRIWPDVMTPPVASVPVGAILSVDGTPWRVLRIEETEGGGRTFYLGPVELPPLPLLDVSSEAPYMISRAPADV